ncbi:MAG: glycoside hydrolase family 127 protein [Opitutaceae bacterium]|nr:glycoside hydrolase family 127 protein [Opitutaceae bacterium]
MPIPVPLDHVRPAGELLRRTQLNFHRLHGPEFQFDAMLIAFTAKDAPGDWVGRCLLSLTLQARLGNGVAPHLEEIVARLPSALNARGYIGEIQAPGTADENQIAGHKALLRGLCEYYRWRADPRALALIRSVVSNLMLPSTPLWASYPNRLQKELLDNQLVGLTVRRGQGDWRGLSTDIGVGFFTLDGLTQVHAVDPSPELRTLIETMITRYAQLDPAALSAQTHSTLSTLRGILRWWRDTAPRPELLALVRDRYRLYRAEAETELHANYNWFGRPDWTEPCAIVDAFMVAVQLWSATGEADYLEEAHRIYFNALAHAQRPNGGYGCDLCTGAKGQLFALPHEYFEAPWCCSMRGTEGLARAAQSGWFTAGDEITLAFYFAGTVRLEFGDGRIELVQTSDYPVAGRVSLRVQAASANGPKTLRWFAPSWSPAADFKFKQNGQELPARTDGAFAVITVALRTGDEITAEFPVRFGAIPLQNPARQPGHHRFAHGPLLLGRAGTEVTTLPAGSTFAPLGGARYRCVATGRELAPLPALIDLSEAEARTCSTQIVFTD